LAKKGRNSDAPFLAPRGLQGGLADSPPSTRPSTPQRHDATPLSNSEERTALYPSGGARRARAERSFKVRWPTCIYKPLRLIITAPRAGGTLLQSEMAYMYLQAAALDYPQDAPSAGDFCVDPDPRRLGGSRATVGRGLDCAPCGPMQSGLLVEGSRGRVPSR